MYLHSEHSHPVRIYAAHCKAYAADAPQVPRCALFWRRPVCPAPRFCFHPSVPPASEELPPRRHPPPMSQSPASMHALTHSDPLPWLRHPVSNPVRYAQAAFSPLRYTAHCLFARPDRLLAPGCFPAHPVHPSAHRRIHCRHRHCPPLSYRKSYTASSLLFLLFFFTGIFRHAAPLPFGPRAPLSVFLSIKQLFIYTGNFRIHITLTYFHTHF